jgi:hypothetical protein
MGPTSFISTVVASSLCAATLAGSAGAQSTPPRFALLHQMLPASAAGYVVIAGDVDGDGDVDLFVGGNGQSRLYLNDGHGYFTDATDQLPHMSGLVMFALFADIDGDGDLDILTVGFAGTSSVPENRLLLNDGTGHFSDATSIAPWSSLDASVLAVLDVDGDGRPDVYVPARPQHMIYLNQGNGTFTSRVGVYQQRFTTAIAFGDVDGDGALDIWCGNSGYAKGPPAADALLLNDGHGAFHDASAQIPYDDDNTYAVSLVDVDGDGYLDAVLVASNVSRVCFNDGTGAFHLSSRSFPFDAQYAQSLAVGDVNGDGYVDLLLGIGGVGYLANDDAAKAQLYLNDGTGTFQHAYAQFPSANDTLSSIVLADIDGDGHLDAVIVHGLSPPHLYFNNGSGVFATIPPPLPQHAEETAALAVGDLDGDGHPDVVAATYHPESITETSHNRLYLNDGFGHFIDASSQLPDIADVGRAVALGDVDGNGALDIVFVGKNRVRLCLNDGSANFTDATAQLPACNEPAYALALGDVNGDGYLDLWLGRASQGRLYLNDGTGHFTDATAQLPAETVIVNAGFLVDVDGDGDLDLLTFGNSERDRLYLNDGHGVFTDASSQLPSSAQDHGYAAIGDVNGDGYVDIVVSGGYDASLKHVYLNDGHGVFTEASGALPPIIGSVESIALADVDGDGHPDLVLGFYNHPRLFLNDGHGVFSEATLQTSLPFEPVNVMAFADVDGDGDIDAIFGGDILFNVTRQIAWRSLARVGRPLTMDLYGPPNGTWRIAAARALGHTSIPPFGTWFLAPPLLHWSSGSFDVQGRASSSLSIPNEPSLIGTSLYWQALIGPPSRFSNVETTTIVGY